MLLHGWAMSPRVWEPVLPALAAEFNVHNLGLPGYKGGPPGAECDDDPDGQALLDRWSDQCLAGAPAGARWVGWSLGALVALNAMLRSPGAIGDAVLVAATPRFLRGADWDAGIEPRVLREFLEGMRMNDDKTLKRFTLLHSDDRRVARTLAGAAGAAGPDVLEAGLRVLEEVDLRPRLAEIGTPARVVHGGRDRIIPPAAGAYVADALAHGELFSLDAGHAPFLEQPRAFIEAVRAW